MRGRVFPFFHLCSTGDIMRFRSLRVLSALFALSSSLAVSARAQRPLLCSLGDGLALLRKTWATPLRSAASRLKEMARAVPGVCRQPRQQPSLQLMLGAFCDWRAIDKGSGCVGRNLPCAVSAADCRQRSWCGDVRRPRLLPAEAGTNAFAHPQSRVVCAVFDAGHGEYDLVSLRGSALFWRRSGDCTKERPAALTPFPTHKQSQTQ